MSDNVDPELRTFIDRAIVPALLERILRELQPAEPQPSRELPKATLQRVG